MENLWKTRGFPETHEIGISLPVHERNKAALLLSLRKQTTHVGNNEYRLDRLTCPGIQSIPPADINNGIHIYRAGNVWKY